MIRRQHLSALLSLLLALFTVHDLTAGNISGTEHYTVNLAPRNLPNGITQPERTFRITRADEGTFVHGVVIVRTRANHGELKGDRVLGSSTVNVTMRSASVTDVRMFSAATNTRPDDPILRATGLDRTYAVRYDEPIDPYDMCKRLMNDPDVEFAVPMRIHKLFFTPNDPRFSEQRFLTQLKVPQAWDVTKGNPNLLVAIIDSGIDWMHEDLAPNIYNNPGEIADNGIDDDHNGYVDDIHGWDFVGNTDESNAAQGLFSPDNDPRIAQILSQTHPHGTVVAGNAVAATNNSTGIAGIASNCRILPVKCGSDNAYAGGIYQGYEAIRYAADMGASVINCSWGGEGVDPAAQSVIDYAVGKGALVVAAAGNEGVDLEEHRQAPATLDGVLSVGSVSSTDKPSTFSNYGWSNATYAPGENPLSTYPGNQYYGMQGTSFSSPVTTGVAALIRSLHPDWTPKMVAMQIRMTGDAVQGIPAESKPMYYSRINAHRALTVNNSWTSGERIHGLYVKSYTISGSGRIVSHEPVTVTFTIVNALADVTDATAQFVQRDPFIEVDNGSAISLGNMPRGSEKQVSLTIRLKDNYPWYSSDLYVGLALRSGITTNYDQARVGVDISTRNAWNVSVAYPQMSFSRTSYAADGTLWSVGSNVQMGQPFCVTGTISVMQGAGVMPFSATAISGFNGTTAVIAGKSGSNTTIAVTRSGGNDWTSTAIGAYSSGVAAIKHYDADNVIAIGTGKANTSKIGVAVSDDGGMTWASSPTSPAQQKNETVPANGVTFFGDNIYIVTSANRVLHSANRGGTWTTGSFAASGTVVTGIAFRDADNGVIVYRSGSLTSAPYQLANTTDGGKTWESDKFDITTKLDIIPIAVSSPGKHHVLVGNDGRVFGSDDNGNSWQVILSRAPGYVSWAQVFETPAGPLLSMSGSVSSVLRYRYSGPNGAKLLMLPETYDFGTVDLGKVRNDYIGMKSTGESDVDIDSMWVVVDDGTPETIFVLGSSLTGKTIAAGNTSSFRINLGTSVPGTYSATVYVKSNATPSLIAIKVTAVVTNTPSSVDEAFISAATMYPNPASDHITLGIPEGTTRVAIVDVMGRELRSMNPDAAAAQTVLYTNDLPTGTYFLVWESAAGHHTKSLTITR